MTRTSIRTGSRFEELAAFSRAVVDGDMIYVSGTTGLDPETGGFADNAADQAEMAFGHIERTLAEAGATFADVLRVVIYITDRDDLMPVCDVVREKFTGIYPANTTVVAQLAVPDMKVEIEVTARRGSAA